jgi:predicted nucleotidyltransferase
MSAMRTRDATAAKNRFGELIEDCARGPVAIERHGRVVAYVVGPAEFRAAPQRTEDVLAARLRAAGAVYATVFGSVAQGRARRDSDIDVAVSFGRPMSSDLRTAMIGIIAEASGRSVDLIDLETAEGLVLARALAGTEIVCDSVATRRRMSDRLLRSEDARRSAAQAARAARARLFP